MKATSTTTTTAARSGRLLQSFAFFSVVAAHPAATSSCFIASSSTDALATTFVVTPSNKPVTIIGRDQQHSPTAFTSLPQPQRRFMMTISSSNNNDRPPTTSSTAAAQIQHVNRQQMEEIVEDFHEGGREESGYCVIDVRTDPEVMMTGKLAASVPTLPVQVILQSNVFALDPEEFEEICGFAKPDLDETLVFTCAAGIRSVYACQAAAAAGYSKLVSYAGGANEWFQPANTQL